MLLELYDFGVETRILHLLAGLALGLVFGVAAQISRFCLRRAVAGPRAERGEAGAVWLTALATAIVAFGAVSAFGLVDISEHRFASANLPIAALVLGGLAFGVGMVLTRGCVSRLTVLSATGNLRAVLVLAAFAVTAHAMLKGVLAPVRTSIGALSIDAPFASLAATPIGLAVLLAPVAALAGYLTWQSRASALRLVLGGVIGLVAVAGWATTSVLLFDEFDPLTVQTAAFTLPWSDTLFWVIAATAIPAGFGVGFIGGVLGGSFLSAAARGELQLQSFESPQQTLSYLAGGALMGFGGVLAGGCTVGAGLSGVATGSIAAIIALLSIAIGGWAASAGALRIGRALPAAA
ncbi:YeeE/YedE family protein [Alphaproteobacteria bacterium GH1-50]|uniref:YeeE/YedE family protein n=1 Tax=Kangsaoukella pontilimi TaxID=2691042 RepID=A0A7C9NDF8_9RHOB|nr:YeeE/YedE family protein [Kangsaoukella pontilimi]MXQ07459.1 YeeE/YedE family protein [Kangsaoukella pontilimi]